MRTLVVVVVLLAVAYAVYAYATSDVPRFGEEGYAYYPSAPQESVILFTSKQAYDAAIKARAAKDDHGFQLAMSQGFVSVAAGTRVHVIDVSVTGSLQVRVLEGPNRGQAGYTIRESVHKKRP